MTRNAKAPGVFRQGPSFRSELEAEAGHGLGKRCVKCFVKDHDKREAREEDEKPAGTEQLLRADAANDANRCVRDYTGFRLGYCCHLDHPLSFARPGGEQDDREGNADAGEEGG